MKAHLMNDEMGLHLCVKKTEVRDSNSKWRSLIFNKAQALSVYVYIYICETNANIIQSSFLFTELFRTQQQIKLKIR